MTVKLMEPTIPLKPAKSGAAANEFFDLDAFKELEGKFYVEPKFDGIRVQAHRQEKEVKIFTDEGHEIQARLPEISKELLSYPNDIFILDGELVKYEDRHILPHEQIISLIHKGEGTVDEQGVRFKLFDILWLDDKSTIELELVARKKLLEEFPDTAHIHKTEAQIIEQRKGETGLVGAIKEMSTSEGAVIKDIHSTYTKEHAQRWWKYKKQHEIDALVTDVEKKDSTFIYTCAVLDDQGNKVEIGKTFATKIEAAAGDVLRVAVDRITFKDDKVSWLIPKVLEKRPPKDVDNFAVLRQLTHSSAHAERVEAWEKALQQAKESMKGKFVLQLHWWGEAAHYDLRMEKQHGWFGFTIPGPGKEALEGNKDASDLKSMLEDGKKILALKKAYYGGKEWLDYGKAEPKEFPPADKPTEGNPSTKLTAYIKAVDWGNYRLEQRSDTEFVISLQGEKNILEGRYFIILAPESMQDKGEDEKWLFSKAKQKEQEAKESTMKVQSQLFNDATILDEPRHIVEVTIIKPGPAKISIEDAQVVYTEDALKASLPLWEGAACFCDHFNKSVRNIAGVYFTPWYDNGVKAKLRFIDDTLYHMVARIMSDRQQQLPVPDVGISADVIIKGMPTDHTLEVTEITDVISADIVFAPAAGGSFDRVLNSVRQDLGITVPQNDHPTPPTAPGEVLVPEKRVRDLQSTADKLRTQVQNQEALVTQLQADLTDAVTKYREGILREHPEIPADLVTGATLKEIDASLAKAQATVESVKKHLEENIPPGAPARRGPDVESMTPRQKIEYGLKETGR